MPSNKYRLDEKALEKIKKANKVMIEDVDFVKLTKKEYEDANVTCPDEQLYKDEREFQYWVNQNPKSHKKAIDTIWRVLDERDLQEYIIYHMYQYVDQLVTQPDGSMIKKVHKIDGYYGFHHKPITDPKAFAPDGTPTDIEIISHAKVYDIPWSVDAYRDLVNDPKNTIKPHTLALGIASRDKSQDVPEAKTAIRIMNEDDFCNPDRDAILRLGKAKLSTSQPSLNTITNTVDLRKKLIDPKTQGKSE